MPEQWYKVKYEDGECEDVTRQSALSMIKRFEREEAGEGEGTAT